MHCDSRKIKLQWNKLAKKDKGTGSHVTIKLCLNFVLVSRFALCPCHGFDSRLTFPSWPSSSSLCRLPSRFCRTTSFIAGTYLKR